MTETQIILIVFALAVIGVFFWRSKREETSMKRLRDHSALGEQREDVLTQNARKEPLPVSDFEDDDEDVAEDKTELQTQQVPADEPPIYKDLEEERQTTVEEAAVEERAETSGFAGVREPIFDYGVQWVLDMSAIGEEGFSYGTLDALNREIKAISDALPVDLWVRAKADGLYYPFRFAPNEANRVVVGIALANRSAVMDAVTASNYLQVMEQVATQRGSDVRPSIDMDNMLALANQVSRFVKFYDNMFEVLIVSKTDAPIDSDLVEKVALQSGFVKNEDAWGRWEYRFDPEEREPVLALASRGEPDGTLHFTFDIPNSNLTRGDLKQFFQMANHLSNQLNARWVDCERHPIDASGALMLQDEVTAKIEKMAAAGVRSGSTRARLLFSRQG